MVPSKASAAVPTVSERVGCWVDGKADVGGVGAYLDGERGFGYQVAGVGADDTAADDSMIGVVEQHTTNDAHTGVPVERFAPGCAGSFQTRSTRRLRQERRHLVSGTDKDIVTPLTKSGWLP
jgi:hypothetical protein